MPIRSSSARPHPRHRLAFAVSAFVLGVACKTGPDLSVDYAQTARENYEIAVSEFTDKDWEESIQYADFIRIRFPFSRYAVEAELLIARANFEAGNYLIAQDEFRQFAKLHPTHKHTRNGWASFMAAASAYMNAPRDVFLMPPAAQRDQARLRDALDELEYYFDHYSGTVTEKHAVALRDEVRRRLLEHELYVADYYLDRDKPEAAIGRLEAAHRSYPGIGLDAEVLFLLGITYLRLEEIELSRSTFAELQAQHPKHHRGKQARVYLRHILDRYGPADPSRPRPDREPPTPKPPTRPKNVADPTRPERAPASSEPASRPSAPASRPTGSPPPAEPVPAEPSPENAEGSGANEGGTGSTPEASGSVPQAGAGSEGSRPRSGTPQTSERRDGDKEEPGAKKSREGAGGSAPSGSEENETEGSTPNKRASSRRARS
jgi:outer membrane protein assembly factor BamD